MNEELKNIARSFKRNRKTFLNSRKLSKKGRSRRCKEEKKEMKMLMKQIRREEKGIRKEEKRAIKMERKRLKIEMKEKLNAARLTTLPLSNGDAQVFMHSLSLSLCLQNEYIFGFISILISCKFYTKMTRDRLCLSTLTATT